MHDLNKGANSVPMGNAVNTTLLTSSMKGSVCMCVCVCG